jgi:hypothetical protein
MVIERLNLINECLKNAEQIIAGTSDFASDEEKENCINSVHVEIINALNHLNRK